jgi:1,4-alpha-glucan branching enzyme
LNFSGSGVFSRAPFCPMAGRTAHHSTMSHHIRSSVKDEAGKRTPTFTKIFRWQPEQTGGPMPVRVEVAGTFNGWQRAALKRDRVSGVWQVTLENIPGNRTHNYMLLVNGRPVHDKHADGLAMPHTAEEKQHQLETPRGPRVFMLASQAK